jgi:hypothetical protein
MTSNNGGVRLNGARGLHENLDPTSKLVIPLSKRNSKGLPDFTVHCI